MTDVIAVLGLDEHNLQTLRDLPDAERYEFRPLLSIDELQMGEDIPVRELLAKAEEQLDSFDPPAAAVIGFWDFPVSTMVPILCRSRQLQCIDLAAVVKCEHKYWSRLEQQKVIDEYPRFGLVDPERDTEPPEGVEFPMWVKPVKSFSSDLAFGVSDADEFRDALAQIREGIGRVGQPFEVILEHVDGLPPEIAEMGGQVCLAEETITGRQVTLEGYRYRGETYIYGVVDSVTETDSPSFVRFQYPASLPEKVTDRMADVSRLIIEQVGLDNATFNIEFFWDEPTGAINVLEVNPRHSQSHAELFERVDGAANHEAMVHLALGRDPGMPHRRGEHAVAAKWFLRHHADGVVRRVPTEEEVQRAQREVPGTTVDVIADSGERLSELIDQDSYSYKIANIYVGADDEDDLVRRYERVVELLPFEIEEQ